MKRRGQALLLVLVVMPVLLTVVLMIGHSTTVHLNLVNRYWNSSQALRLARSVVVTAAAELRLDKKYSGDLVLNFPELGDPGARAELTFKKNGKVPHSTNNGASDSSVQGSLETLVPRHMYHLVGVGTFGGVTRRYEALLATAPYDHALASSGSLISQGGLLVGALKQDADVRDGIDTDELTGSTLAVNGADGPGGASLQITGKAEIHGDVRVVGSAELGAEVDVRGTVFPNSAPEELPKIRVEDYDPTGRPGCQTLATPSYAEQRSLTGFAKRTGNLVFEQGLKLERGVLYVDGDLEVRGPLEGVGAVFCTGKVTLRGGASFATDNQCAIVAKGDLRVLGSGQQRSLFSGLLYTEGVGGFPGQDVDQDLVVQDVTLAGAAVSAGRGTAGLGSKMTVERSTVAFAEEGTGVSFEPGFSGEWPIAVRGRAGNGRLELREVTENGKPFTPGPAYFARQGRAGLSASDFVFTDAGGRIFEVGADGSVPDALDHAFKNGRENIDRMGLEIAQAQGSDPKEHGAFWLDLNEFLQAADRLKVVMRRI